MFLNLVKTPILKMKLRTQLLVTRAKIEEKKGSSKASEAANHCTVGKFGLSPYYLDILNILYSDG